MSTVVIPKDVKNHFDFLFDRGFSIQSITSPLENMGNWMTTLESSQCLLRIINEHGEISVDIGPTSRGNGKTWFSINAIIFYITEGHILLDEFQDHLPGIDQQYQRLAELLRKYLDQIVLIMGNEFANHEEKLVKAMKTVTGFIWKGIKHTSLVNSPQSMKKPSKFFQVSSAPNKACTRLVGVCAFSGSLRGLKLVPSKWRCLSPPTSG